MAITMDGIFVNGQKVTFAPENILSGDASAYTEEIGTAVEAWMEENVTGGEQVTDTTLTLPGVPADSKKTGDEIGALKEDLNVLSGVGEQVVLTSGGYITTNIDVIDVSDITDNAGYKYAVVECAHGDKYTISASTTGAKARLWCFTDAEYNVLSVASAGGSVENLVITAPAGTAYLIVNAYIAGVNPNPTVSKGAGNLNGRLIPCENAVAKVQKNADSIDTLEQDMDAIKSGLVLTEVFDAHPLMLQYSMSNAGTMGSTSNKKYFGNGYNYVALTRFSGNLLMTCDESVTESYKYAFFDADKVLIGEIVTVSPAVSNAYITVPEGAKFINLQGVSTVEAMAEQARASMVVYGYAVLYPELVSRVASLESTKETTTLARLRIRPNSNNINFVVKTGLTNLYLGYGSGGYNEEDGTGAGYDNGKYNVAVGYEAFKNNETGDHSTAVGYCALRGNVSGDFNTCLGEDTMYSNTTGSNNVAIGTHALQSNNGSDNVVIGADSVRHISDATRNKCIVIGGYINLDSDATNVIVIGQGRKSGSPDYTTITGSNKIVIGNANHETVIIAGKIIHFNQDGTVTWESAT